MEKKITGVLIALVVAFVVANMAFFTVDQTQQAIVVRLGKPVGDIKGPGLHFKLPAVHEVIYFENRLLEYDSAPAEILTEDKKALVLDNYSRWRIADPLLFYKTVRNIRGAQARLDDIIYAQLRVELGRHSLTDIVSKVRSDVMERVTARSDKISEDYGIEVVDVRIKRADLPPENENAVYGRMRAERERKAKKYRSEGQEESLKIQADADKDRTILLAEAYEKAETIKGEGDAEAVKIYAKAFGKDMEFFSFLKTLEANERSMGRNTTLVLSPKSEFLKYFGKSGIRK
ncbi:MAG: protease modulator HflC [Deltaproteobacteria bacterium]|nr:protease modulator HflC [Deltaproteobacteria bacterium]